MHTFTRGEVSPGLGFHNLKTRLTLTCDWEWVEGEVRRPSPDLRLFPLFKMPGWHSLCRKGHPTDWDGVPALYILVLNQRLSWAIPAWEEISWLPKRSLIKKYRIAPVTSATSSYGDCTSSYWFAAEEETDGLSTCLDPEVEEGPPSSLYPDPIPIHS